MTKLKYLSGTPYKDYAIGDVVKYKEFYYTAINKVSGTRDFVSSSWYRLDDKPTPGLITNLEYKTNQFADFYDLDTDNFDVGQQEIAQTHYRLSEKTVPC